MRLLYSTTLLLFGFLLSGCTVNYKNVSDHKAVSHYIGKTYLLNADMSIQGINLPPGYGDNIDVYYISKLYKVMHKSPEEITSDILPKGSNFIITGVYECSNCIPFIKRRYVTVTTNDFVKTVDVPIRVSMHVLTSEESISEQ